MVYERTEGLADISTVKFRTETYSTDDSRIKGICNRITDSSEHLRIHKTVDVICYATTPYPSSIWEPPEVDWLKRSLNCEGNRTPKIVEIERIAERIKCLKSSIDTVSDCAT